MPALWEKAGEAAFSTQSFPEAIAYYQSAALTGSLDKEGWLILGLAYQAVDQLEKSVPAWQNAVPLVAAYEHLAGAARSAGNLGFAMDYLKQAVSVDPGNAPDHYELGLMLMATSPGEALPELLQAAQLEPELTPTVLGLQQMLNKANQNPQAAAQFLAAGQALAALEEWDLAEAAFQESIKKDEGFALGWAWLGEARQRSGLDGSREVKHALELAPGSPDVLAFYGLNQQRQGQVDIAIQYLRKAVFLDPNNAGWQLALGGAYEQKGDLVAAYASILKATALDPAAPATWKTLADFCITNEVDVLETGLPAAQRFGVLAPGDWQAYDLAGLAEFSLGNYPLAEENFLKAVELSPYQAAPALHMGLVSLQAGRWDQAETWLLNARRYNPAGTVGWQAGRLLEQYFP
jgi:tetratricopeptide (TPR) repeat protein